MGIPREKQTIGEFGFPPPALYETAFRHDPFRFWRLAPGYNGPWEMYKSKYTHERNLSSADLRDRIRTFPDTSYYRGVTWNINSEGFRGRPHEPEKQVALFLGSSVTFGWGVRAEDAFPSLIQSKLTESGHPVWTVINAGVPGYSSYQCLKTLEEISRTIRPRLIVVEIGINEGIWAPGLPDGKTAAALQDTWSARLVRGSNALFALNQAVRGRSDTKDAEVVPPPSERFFYTSMFVPGHVRVPEEDFRENVAKLEEAARQLDAEILFLFPGLFNEYGEGTLVKSVRFSHPREVDIVEAINREAGTSIANCFLPYDEAHLSIKGHHIVEDRVWKQLLQEDLLRDSKGIAPAPSRLAQMPLSRDRSESHSEMRKHSSALARQSQQTENTHDCGSRRRSKKGHRSKCDEQQSNEYAPPMQRDLS